MNESVARSIMRTDKAIKHEEINLKQDIQSSMANLNLSNNSVVNI